jgi:hypothetical protein
MVKSSKKRSTMRRNKSKKQRGGATSVPEMEFSEHKSNNGKTLKMYYGKPSDILLSKNLGFKIYTDFDEPRPVDKKYDLSDSHNFIFVKNSSTLSDDTIKDNINRFRARVSTLKYSTR